MRHANVGRGGPFGKVFIFYETNNPAPPVPAILRVTNESGSGKFAGSCIRLTAGCSYRGSKLCSCISLASLVYNKTNRRYVCLQ